MGYPILVVPLREKRGRAFMHVHTGKHQQAKWPRFPQGSGRRLQTLGAPPPARRRLPGIMNRTRLKEALAAVQSGTEGSISETLVVLSEVSPR